MVIYNLSNSHRSKYIKIVVEIKSDTITYLVTFLLGVNQKPKFLLDKSFIRLNNFFQTSRSPAISTKFWSKPFNAGKNRGRPATDRPIVEPSVIRQHHSRENPIARLGQNGFFFVVNQTNRGE